MTGAFWKSFEKRATGSIDEWIDDEAAAETAAKEHKTDTRCDPRELSEWQGPENWYRWGQ